MSGKVHSIKVKLISKLPVRPEGKKRPNQAYITAVSGLETVLTIVKDVAGSAGPPGLKAGISGLLFVLDVLKVDPYHTPLHVLVEDFAKCGGHRATCRAH